MKNNDGFVLAAVLAMTVLVMLLGTAAIKMSELGYLAFGSERKYQIAGTAAEFAINTAILSVSTTGSCPSANTGTLSTGGVNASYSYFSVSGGSNCFIHSTGGFSSAKVVKTAVVPAGLTGNWAGLVLNSGTLTLGGSGAVTFCDTACANGGPAVLYKGATTISGTSPSDKLPAACASNEKGPVGHPPTSQNTSLPDDLVSTYFNSDSWSDLLSDLRTKYQVDAVSLASLSSSCKYTGTSTCSTDSTTNIKCGTDGSAVNISLTTCSRVYISNAELTIAHDVSNKTIYSEKKVTVTGSTTDVNVLADSVYINLGSNVNVSGGTFYSKSTTAESEVEVKSNASLGSSSKPILFIAEGPTEFESNGGPDIYGLIFTRSTAIEVEGNIVFKGSFINNNAATITFGGNASIQFNSSVLSTLKTNLGTSGTGLQTPTCPQRQTNSSLVNTKVTVY